VAPGGAVALGGAHFSKFFQFGAHMGDFLKSGATQRHRATPPPNRSILKQITYISLGKK